MKCLRAVVILRSRHRCASETVCHWIPPSNTRDLKLTTPDSQSLRREIESLDGVVVVPLNQDSFFFYDPDEIGESARMFPMATIVTSNAYDNYSDLDREGVFRLNLGVDKETFHELFGREASNLAHDYTKLDVVMPHPDYGNSFFVCVLNPVDSLPQVRKLIAKAHEIAAGRYRRKHKS